MFGAAERPVRSAVRRTIRHSGWMLGEQSSFTSPSSHCNRTKANRGREVVRGHALSHDLANTNPQLLADLGSPIQLVATTRTPLERSSNLRGHDKAGE